MAKAKAGAAAPAGPAVNDARLQIGEDLYVVFAEIASLKEQDVNAQIMQPRHFDRLAENIRSRGAIESLPYCHQPGGTGQIDIVSGHHRARAARAAGLTTIPVIVDTRTMRRSEVIAKQIAHNELHGSPDEQILRQLVAMIDHVDDLLATGLPEDYLPTVEADDTTLQLPHAEFDWRLVSLTFLPQQLEEFKTALDIIDNATEIVAVAQRDQFDAFAKAAHQYGRFTNIRNLATVVGSITQIAAREIAELQDLEVDDRHSRVRIPTITGNTIPADAAAVVAKAIEAASGEDDIGEHRWRALHHICAAYLAGRTATEPAAGEAGEPS